MNFEQLIKNVDIEIKDLLKQIDKLETRKRALIWSRDFDGSEYA
jgi:hypothetical protein